MLFADTTPEQLLGLLGQYRSIAYLILFFGAFLETLIPFSLVVYGEIFFLSGAVLAGVGELDIRVVAAVLYTGGIIGDNSSFWIGRKYGICVFDTLCRWPIVRLFFHESMREKGMSFFYHRGESAVFFARLCGPFSWFVPALAGAFGQRYGRFVLCNTLGIIIGIGEFLVAGYLIGNNFEKIHSWLSRLGCISLSLMFSCLVLYLWSHYSADRKLNGSQ